MSKLIALTHSRFCRPGFENPLKWVWEIRTKARESLFNNSQLFWDLVSLSIGRILQIFKFSNLQISGQILHIFYGDFVLFVRP